MVTDETYRKRIQSYNWNKLERLWLRIKNGTTTRWWDAGKAFEYLILKAFELDSALVRYPYQVKMEEEVVEKIDGAVHIEGLSCLVECKDYSERNVDIEPIAKIRNQLLRRPSSAIGLIFSKTGFTEPALTLAQHLAPQTILLWSSQEIDYIIQKREISKFLKIKYIKCIEEGMPDYFITIED